MKVLVTGFAAAALLSTAHVAAAQQPSQPPAAPAATAQAPAQPESGPPLRVYLHAGLKTHAEGQHDYPQFLADWSKLLTNRGAIVDGGLHFPSARELAGVDVMVIYKGDAGYLSIEDRATLDAYLRRGGGLVSFHDALCGPEPEYFAAILGGAKKHGEVNYTLEADVAYTIVDTAHPIMQGDDRLHDQGRSVLPDDVGEVAGDQRARDGADGGDAERRHAQGRSRAADLDLREHALPGPGSQPYRAFVWMQGHNYANFANPAIQAMLLRGIAWAGKRPADALMTERPQPQRPPRASSSAPTGR